MGSVRVSSRGVERVRERDRWRERLLVYRVFESAACGERSMLSKPCHNANMYGGNYSDSCGNKIDNDCDAD